MKKNLLPILIIVLTFFSVTGCRKDKSPEVQIMEAEGYIIGYHPCVANSTVTTSRGKGKGYLVATTDPKQLGFKDPIGQTVRHADQNLRIVGVVKDYIVASRYIESQPIIIRGAVKRFGAVTLKLNTRNPVTENISRISAVFKRYNPSYPFRFKFMDESYREKFQDEQNAGQMVGMFAGLSIFISCLGLFALAACIAEGRIKEIGIRKVLGASVAAITALLTKDFLALVLIAFAIASPVAWWVMNKWLQGYTYHTELSWWIFGLTGFVSVIIALFTVGFQAIKAAMGNPVKSLKTE